jgi:hypothetical protein
MSDGRERPDRRSDDDAAGWAGTMAGFDGLMVPIRPQAPNAVKRGDSQPEDGPLSVRQRPRITVSIDGFNLYYALLKPDPAVR